MDIFNWIKLGLAITFYIISFLYIPDEVGKRRSGIFINVLSVILMVAVMSFSSYKRGEKFGQVEAINGNIKYQLVIQPDSSKVWEKIKPDAKKKNNSKR